MSQEPESQLQVPAGDAGLGAKNRAWAAIHPQMPLLGAGHPGLAHCPNL